VRYAALVVCSALFAASGCTPTPSIELQVSYTGASVAALHVRLTSPDFDPVRYYYGVEVDDGVMDFIEGDVLLRETIDDFEAIEIQQEGWEAFGWIDLQGDERTICLTEPLNAVECAPDLQDPQTRFDFILLPEESTAVDVVISD
jgi:hypothetical protein